VTGARLLALALALAAPSARAASTAELLKSLEDAGRALKTMKAQFVESRVSLLLNEQTEAKGDVTLSVPGRFRWNYEAPQPGVMIVKDGRFARYVPQSKQVFRGPAKGDADLLVGFGPGASGLGRKYDVTLLPDEKVGETPTYVLDLKQRSGDAGLFAAVRLWIDKTRFIPVQTRLTEPTGDHTTIRFEQVVINGPLAPSSFDLKLPRDVVEVQ
jgi:outer membrane lipoprotein carrier protein